jgi:hypothetical protein
VLTRRHFLGSPALAAAPAPVNNLALWYKQSAKLWTEALPVGNGRLGAMVFGGVDSERLQLNEDTLWSGFRKDWNNPAAKAVLPEIRRLLRQEKYTEADALCKKCRAPRTSPTSHSVISNFSSKASATLPITAASSTSIPPSPPAPSSPAKPPAPAKSSRAFPID